MDIHREHIIVDQEKEHLGDKLSYDKERFLRPIDTAGILKSLLWYEFELSRMTAGWIPAVANYEMKIKLARFSYLHSRHVKNLHIRILELPKGLSDKEWTPEWMREMFENLSMAENEHTFLNSYLFLLQRLYTQYDELMLRLDRILDEPTIDQININLLERAEMISWVNDQVQFAYVDDVQQKANMQEWKKYISVVWNVYIEGIQQQKKSVELKWPNHPVYEPAGPVPNESVLDPRFPQYVSETEMKAFSDPAMSPLFDSVKQMVFINTYEIAAAELLAYMYYGVKQMPLEFFYDLARHMNDEVRHSRMGLRRLQQLGFTTEQFKWGKGTLGNQSSEARFADMYSSLTMIGEACSFKKKRKSVEAFWKFGDVLSAIQSEYDIVDERLHVDFGTKWGPELYKQLDQMVTAQTMAERARIRRMEQLEIISPEEYENLAKNLPAFCGFSTSELEYNKY